MPEPATAQLESTSKVRQGVVSLFVANGIAFGVVGWCYLALSKVLVPAELGLYSAALVVGSFGTMVLDAGIKNTVIKASVSPTRNQQGVLVGLLLVISLALLALLMLGSQPLSHYRPEVRHDYRFLVLFGAIYLISYPFIIVPTAMLERRLSYVRLAWIESLGLLVERAGPLPLLLWSHWGVHSFTIALLAGRALRVVALNSVYPVAPRFPTRTRAREVWHLLVEGVWFQVATASSLVRDNLNVLLIGPLFGKQWIGYYAWGLQLGMIASQAFVQIASRVSLPLLAQSRDAEQRRNFCLIQSKILTILTGPVLLVMLAVIAQADRVLFNGKWGPATALLPLLFFRMLTGMSCTPLAILVMVQAGNRAFAWASMVWTLGEVVAAVAFIAWLGPTGLAWSMMFCACLGVVALARAAEPNPGRLLRQLLADITMRPSLIFAAIGAVVVHHFSASDRHSFWTVAAMAAAVVLASIAVEPTLRNMLTQRPQSA